MAAVKLIVMYPMPKDMAAFEHHAALPHTRRFVEAVEPLLDHPFKATVTEKIW